MVERYTTVRVVGFGSAYRCQRQNRCFVSVGCRGSWAHRDTCTGGVYCWIDEWSIDVSLDSLLLLRLSCSCASVGSREVARAGKCTVGGHQVVEWRSDVRLDSLLLLRTLRCVGSLPVGVCERQRNVRL